MHESSMLRMQWFRENFFNDIAANGEAITVLDLGSQCVPDQSLTYKTLFNNKPFKYVGLDMVEGYNVDIVLKNAYCWDEINNDSADVLISGQVFEHVEFPWITISEIARVVKPNGLICIIVPSMQPFHRYPVNCQNYFCDGMIALSKYAGLEVLHASTNRAPVNAPVKWYNRGTKDTMLIARKPVNWIAKSFDIKNYVCEPADLEKMGGELIPLIEQPWYKKAWFKKRFKRMR